MSDPAIVIGGAWTRSSGMETLDVHEPAAREALDYGARGRTSALERARPLLRRGRLVQRDAGRLAQIEARDTGKPASVAKRVRTGQMFVNCYGAGAGIELPFGGSGKSGHGREKGFAALRDSSKTKTTVFNHGREPSTQAGQP